MSPMWLTSKTPTPPRTALCSATNPPLDGYSTGISQPPKLTIFAPRRRCSVLSDVLRSSVVVDELSDSIPRARAEIDTSTQCATRQRSAPECELLLGRCKALRVNLSLSAVGVRLAARCPVRYSFPGGLNARSDRLFRV